MNAILNVNDFRLPEEVEYAEALKSHPGIKRLEKQFPKIVPEEESDKSQLLNYLNKNGVKIAKSTSSTIIENLEKSFLLFGQKIPKYEIFAIKNLQEEVFGESIKDENATVLKDNEAMIILFVHNILNTMTENEIKSVIGHEIGHFLLGHSQNELLRNVMGSLQDMQESQIMKNQNYLDMWVSCHLLSQLQELSADRVGLIVSQDLESTISGLAKIAGGLIGGRKLSVQDYIKQAIETPLEPEDIQQTHPYHPHRSWALAEFYESDAFQKKILGKEGGKPISEFSKLLPKIIPLPTEANSKSTLSLEDKPCGVDDYLLELFIYNAIGWADEKFTPAESKTITKFFPLVMRDEVFQRWNEMNDDWESRKGEEAEKIFAGVYEEAYRKAAQKDTRWKAKMVKRMIKLIKADRRVSESELTTLGGIAQEIDAWSEFKKQCLKEFGLEPSFA